MGFLECSCHCASSWKVSASMNVCAHRSIRVSSSCGWKTLTRKSSRNEVSVLVTTSDPGGTTSFNRLRNPSEGGSNIPMLKTLGSTRSLCPVALPSCPWLLEFVATPLIRFESDTRPGTEDLSMCSKSSLSEAKVVDVISMSESLNIF